MEYNSNFVNDTMNAMRVANPDISDIELNGVTNEHSNLSDFLKCSWPMPVRWSMKITFNDGDFFETKLYDSYLDAIKEAKDRLKKWIE